MHDAPDDEILAAPRRGDEEAFRALGGLDSQALPAARRDALLDAFRGWRER